MKKGKLLLISLIGLILCGCTNSTSSEKYEIKTTIYPVEYITSSIYGSNSNITSIYPNGSDQNYKVSDKLLKDYSKTNIFIFNGESEQEKEYLYKMNSYNNKLKIVDVSQSLAYTNGIEELWLDPMNLLTMANNVKKGFEEYISSSLLLKDIKNNYKNLKLNLIKIDADYRDTITRANNKTIIVGNDLYAYLSKYGLNVISLEESDKLSKKNIYDAEELIKDGKIKYIYVKKGEKLNKTITNFVSKYNVEVIELHTLYTLTDEERKNNKNYNTIMYENLDLLSKSLYGN